MGGGGSAAAMNAVINNNRKLLKRKAHEKMGYNGVYSNTNKPSYSFDYMVYNDKAKAKVKQLIANRKKEAFWHNIIAIILSVIFVIIIFAFYKFYLKSFE